MQVGDTIKFKGSWGGFVPSGERRTGTVMEVWWTPAYRFRPTRKLLCADILWDNGDRTRTMTKFMEVVNASR